jgi:hypothetical protein
VSLGILWNSVQSLALSEVPQLFERARSLSKSSYVQCCGKTQ